MKDYYNLKAGETKMFKVNIIFTFFIFSLYDKENTYINYKFLFSLVLELNHLKNIMDKYFHAQGNSLFYFNILFD